MNINRRIPRAEVEAAKSPSGGWTRSTLAGWGVPWPPPKGWRQALEIEQRAWPVDEATQAALDIRQWTDGPNPSWWRVHRLAQALRDA